MFETRFIDFRVNCPCRSFRTEEMQIKQFMTEKGWIPMLCNGCDNGNGSDICERCRADVFLMFYRDPNLDISQPITPKTPEKDS